jgi:hypothetical protein
VYAPYSCWPTGGSVKSTGAGGVSTGRGRGGGVALIGVVGGEGSWTGTGRGRGGGIVSVRLTSHVILSTSC